MGFYVWSAPKLCNEDPRPPESHLTLNGRNVNPLRQSCKKLSVIFDKRIAWRLHIEIIETKVLRTFIRIYCPFKNERLSADINLTSVRHWSDQ
jgi:hypothetical protein